MRLMLIFRKNKGIFYYHLFPFYNVTPAELLIGETWDLLP